jgi:preprotein translocase subunit SecE
VSTSTASTRGSTEQKSPRGLGKILLFIRQVVDELREVVRPTRDELVSYTLALIVFLVLIMAYVLGLDQLMVRLVSWVFG